MCNVDYVKKDVNNVQVQRRREGLRALVVVGVILQSFNAFAVGSLGIANPIVEDNKVVFPIVLGGDVGTGVAALDFRFRYNPDTLRPVSVVPGSAASAANKRLMANVAAPGEYIVVMFGMSNSPDQTACASGEVARVVMERVGQDKTPVWGLSLGKSTLTSVDGTSIPSHALPYRGTNSGTKPNEEQPSQPVEVNVPTSTGSGKAPDAKVPTDAAARAANDAFGKMAALPDGGPVDLASVLAKIKEAREGVRSPGKSPAGTDAPNAAVGSGEVQKVASTTESDKNIAAGSGITEQSNAGANDKDMSGSPTCNTVKRSDIVEQDNASKPSEVAVSERGMRGISLERPFGKVGVAFGAVAVGLLVVIGFLVRRHRRLD